MYSLSGLYLLYNPSKHQTEVQHRLFSPLLWRNQLNRLSPAQIQLFLWFWHVFSNDWTTKPLTPSPLCLTVATVFWRLKVINSPHTQRSSISDHRTVLQDLLLSPFWTLMPTYLLPPLAYILGLWKDDPVILTSFQKELRVRRCCLFTSQKRKIAAVLDLAEDLRHVCVFLCCKDKQNLVGLFCGGKQLQCRSACKDPGKVQDRQSGFGTPVCSASRSRWATWLLLPKEKTCQLSPN